MEGGQRIKFRDLRPEEYAPMLPVTPVYDTCMEQTCSRYVRIKPLIDDALNLKCSNFSLSLNAKTPIPPWSFYPRS
jgi:hypothetical protein